MPRITKIDLQNKIGELMSIIENFKQRIFELESKNNDYLSGNGYVSEELYNGLVKQIELEIMLKDGFKRHLDFAKEKIELLENKIAELIEFNERQKSNSVHKLINERCAGRKPIDNKLVEKIIQLKKQGLSYRKIADNCDVSIGTINKVLLKNN